MLGPECTNSRVYTHASATIIASLVTAPSREQARAIPVRNRLQCLPNKSSEPSYSIWAVQRLRTSLCTDPARRTASHQLESSLAVTPPISNLKTALITGCGVPQFAISRSIFLGFRDSDDFRKVTQHGVTAIAGKGVQCSMLFLCIRRCAV